MQRTRKEESSKVRECMVHAQVIDMQTPLADAMDVIHKHDFVIVRDKERKVTGIVTAVDLTHEFKQLTYPFLLIARSNTIYVI